MSWSPYKALSPNLPVMSFARFVTESNLFLDFIVVCDFGANLRSNFIHGLCLSIGIFCYFFLKKNLGIRTCKTKWGDLQYYSDMACVLEFLRRKYGS